MRIFLSQAEADVRAMRDTPIDITGAAEFLAPNRPAVDHARGIIRGVAIASRGVGGGVDAAALCRMADMIGTGMGCPLYYRRQPFQDSLGLAVGHITRPRLASNGALSGDIVFGPYADKLPGPMPGTVASYLLGLAQEDPREVAVEPILDTDDDGNRVLKFCNLVSASDANPFGLCRR